MIVMDGQMQRFCLNCCRDLNDNYGEEIRWLEKISVKVAATIPGSSSLNLNTVDKEIEQDVSIVDALSYIFPSNSIFAVNQNAEPFVVCMDCGEALSTLFGAYFQLLNLSNTNARITELIRQVEIWHSTNTLLTSAHSSATDILEAYNTALLQDFSPIKSEEQEIESMVKDEYETSVGLGQALTLDDIYCQTDALDSLTSTGNIKRANPSPVSRKARKVKKPKVLQEGYVPHLNEVVIDMKPQNNELVPPKKSASPKKRRKEPRQSKTSNPFPEKIEANELITEIPKMRRKKFRARKRPSVAKKNTITNRIRKAFPCTVDECSESFSLKWELERHKLKVHENVESRRCELCIFEYFDEELYKNHHCKIREFNTRRCKYCGIYIDPGADFRSHKRTHEQKELWTCTAEECERIFFTSRSLALHFAKCHPGGSKPELPKVEPKVKCPIEGCERIFLYQANVDRHIIIEHSGRPKGNKIRVLCPEPDCGKMVIKCHLSSHIRKEHLNERNFVCEACGKSFKDSGVLKGHILYKHSSIRRYKCPLCNVSFKGPQELRTHWKGKIHSPEETAELLKSKVVPNVGPDEIPILPPKKYYGKKKSETLQFQEDDMGLGCSE